VKFRLLWKIDLLATLQIGVDLHLELYYDRSIIVIPLLYFTRIKFVILYYLY
jgi:hypothetical protein